MKPDDTQAIFLEINAFTEAWNQGDARAAADFFTEDGLRVGAMGDIQRGRAELVAAYEILLRNTLPGAKLVTERGSVRILTPELAIWQAGLEINRPDGGSAVRGHIVQIMKKVNNRWLILESHPKFFPPEVSGENGTSSAQVNRSMPPGVIIPELAYADVDSAADWLCAVLGFSKRLQIGSHRIQLVLDGTSIIAVSAPAGQIQPSADHSIMVRVADVDRHYEHSRQNGARIISIPEDYPYGERQYSLQDPGGHVWTFSQSIADIDPSEWGGILINSK